MFLSFWGLLYPKIHYPLHTSGCAGHPLPHLASLETPAAASRIRRRTLRLEVWVSQAEMADVSKENWHLWKLSFPMPRECNHGMVRIDEKEMVAWPTKEDRIWPSPQIHHCRNRYMIWVKPIGPSTKIRILKLKKKRSKICCQIRLRLDFRRTVFTWMDVHTQLVGGSSMWQPAG